MFWIRAGSRNAGVFVVPAASVRSASAVFPRTEIFYGAGAFVVVGARLVFSRVCVDWDCMTQVQPLRSLRPGIRSGRCMLRWRSTCVHLYSFLLQERTAQTTGMVPTWRWYS